MWIVLAATLLAGCASDGNDSYPPGELDASFTTCTQPTDCVVVELGCCDDCNGGLAVAVNNASAAEVEAAFSESCGNNTACTLMACADWEISCDAGTCAAVRGTFE
jgi:hypothetical protein